MTFRQRISEGLDAVSDARKASLLGPYSENVVQLNFCYKLRSSNSTFDTPVHDRPADGTNSTLDTQVHDRSTDGSNSTLDTLVNDKPAGDSSNSTLDTPVQERPADGSNSTLDTPVHDMPVDDSNSTLYNPVHGWPAGDYGIYRAEGICPQGNGFVCLFDLLLYVHGKQLRSYRDGLLA